MPQNAGDETKLASDEGRLTCDLSQKVNIVSFTNHEANRINDAEPFLPIFPTTTQHHTDQISGLAEETNRD